MKKLLLLMAAGLTMSSAFAQYGNNSVVFSNFQEANPKKAIDASHRALNLQTNTANKTTGGPKSGWFSYVDVMASTNIKGWYSSMYNDSTLRGYDASTSSYYFVKHHGSGFSFDPYSKVWDSAFVDINSIPGFTIAKTQGYTIDSVTFDGRYNRQSYNNYTDTLFFDLVKMGGATTGVSTFSLRSGPSAANANQSSDSTLRFNLATYDADRNKISDSTGADKISWYILLNQAFFNDSSANGSHGQSIVVPNGGLQVAAGNGAVLYMHFKSGHVYPFGTNIDSANTWRQFSYELAGENTLPVQVAKEVNCGLISTWESRYAPYYIPYQGHRMTIPTLFYSADAGNDWPYFAFHVQCADCENAGVAHVSGIIGAVKAYPNPANSEVKMPVTVNKAANVTVSLINTLGQNVAAQDLGKVAAGQTATATFSTSSLPAGIYIYSVNADGQVMTGRVVVAH